jgi:hypothetical protein
MSKSGANASKKRDNLAAARVVRDALHGFTHEEQKLILRWAAESLGINPVLPAAPAANPVRSIPTPTPPAPAVAPMSGQSTPKTTKDINAFVNEKNPQTDIQLATTIAYYYRFEAPDGQRKDEIDADSLRDACRLAGRPGKLVKPLKTLNNAHASGLLDRGSSAGWFSINTVGENLVGMTLPSNPSARRKAPKQK